MSQSTRDTREHIRQLLQCETSHAKWDERLDEMDSSELLHAVFQLVVTGAGMEKRMRHKHLYNYYRNNRITWLCVDH